MGNNGLIAYLFFTMMIVPSESFSLPSSIDNGDNMSSSMSIGIVIAICMLHTTTSLTDGGLN
jgi:hypothetical protein